MKIRLAKQSDYHKCLPLMRNFFSVAPHAVRYGLTFDENSAAALFNFLCSDKYHCALVAVEEAEDKEPQVTGILCGGLKNWMVNQEQLIANELGWWVEPESRGRGAAIRLLEAFKQWAQMHGATLLVMSCIDDLEGGIVGKLYERGGFKKEETSYFLKLGGD